MPPSQLDLSTNSSLASPVAVDWRASVAPSRRARRRNVLVVALAAIVALAATFRVYGLDYGGFSEDEANKVNAVRAYRAGDFRANAEHPMLMKLAMAASSGAADTWNRAAPAADRAVALRGAGAIGAAPVAATAGGETGSPPTATATLRGDTRTAAAEAPRSGWAISPEAALRLPNALAGAAIVVPLFLLTKAFFGPFTALWAALLFALDVNATGMNRIGKEDTLLVLFLLLGAWCYEEARARHVRDGRPPHRWYAASGGAFGLMLASKYMPYYLGLWAIFGLAAHESTGRPGDEEGIAPVTQRASWWFYATMAVAFVVANPAILLPETWQYLLGYLGGKTITHHGAFFNGTVYQNMIGATPWGLPWYFYLVYLGCKTPLPVLAAIVVGLVELVRRRRQRGAVFARVFLVLFLLPASLVASKFGRYLLPTLVVLDVVAALGVVRLLQLAATRVRASLAVPLVAAIATTIAGGALLAQARSAPYPTLNQNAIGRHVAAAGTMFPNDELYDMGVREAVMWVAQRAAPGAAVVSDAPGVVAEYVRRAGRPDLQARSLSMAGLPGPPTETWLLAQDSHACFESLQTVTLVRRRQSPDYVYRVRGTRAVEVFRMPWGP